MRTLIFNVFVPNRLVTFLLLLPVAGFIERLIKEEKNPHKFPKCRLDGKSFYHNAGREKGI